MLYLMIKLNKYTGNRTYLKVIIYNEDRSNLEIKTLNKFTIM